MNKSKAKTFIKNYWFEDGKPSKSITDILGWFVDGKITKEGLRNYILLIENLND